MYKYKFILLFIIPLFQVSNTSSQVKADAGIFAGACYYLGDINPDHQFYSVSPSLGGLYRIVLNSRYALRAQFTYGNFNGRDSDFPNEYQKFRNASFSTSVLDIGFIGEYNFFPFKYNERQKTISPYLFTGVAYDHILFTNTNVHSHFSIPFGLGVKYYLLKNVKIGLEWSLRKTFTDNIDGVVNPGNDKYKSLLSNKDWYSFSGFFITFGLFEDNNNCPAYQ